MHEPGVALAERLLGLLNTDGRVFFCNSGAEANEAAIKLVRRKQGADKPVVAAIGSFHGRTMGSLSITGKDSIREPFGPFGTTVRWIPYGDTTALASAVDDSVAAVFLEPTLGEGGVVPPPDGYLTAVRGACDAAGALLVLDEIQSGIGRTGAWFAHQRDGIVPDVLTLAKGLGGGLPIGACIGFGRRGHGVRQGRPRLDVRRQPDRLRGRARGARHHRVAAHPRQRQRRRRTARRRHRRDRSPPAERGTRQRALARRGRSPRRPPRAVNAVAQAHGFLVNAVQPDAVRLAPPLILSAAEAQEFLDAFPAILTEAHTGTVALCPGTSSATTTSPQRSNPRFWSWPWR